MPLLLATRYAALQDAPECLAGRPPLAVLFPLAGLAPSTRQPQHLAAGVACESVPLARDEPCRGARECPPDLFSPLPSPVVDACHRCVVCARAHTIGGGAHQTRVAAPGPCAHL